MKRKSDGIDMNVLSVILFLCAAVTMLLSLQEVKKVDLRIQEKAQIEQNRRECEAASQQLREGSDYLTSEVWHYIATGKPEHMENYWNEVYEIKSRDQALETLKNLKLTPEEQKLIDGAKNESDRLIFGEAWAMRMVVEAVGMEQDALPDGVAAVTLTREEKQLPAAIKRQKAMDYIFGEEYTSSKKRINDYIVGFRKALLTRKDQELDLAIRSTQDALRTTQMFNCIMLFYLLLVVVLFYLLATRPFQRYALTLKAVNGAQYVPLKPTGSRETKEVATAFNRIYRDWSEQKKSLEDEKRAREAALADERSRDGLTGLYNKEAGLRMVQKYMKEKPQEETCGMMLLDMDDFDTINQMEGGGFADAVLQEVADIIRAKTGPDDIQVRLGGDEFMLFVKNCPKSRATVLGPEIAKEIRELAVSGKTDVKISASIGMCVTEVVDEYSGLYRCADSALNYVKSHEKGVAVCYLDMSNELGIMLTQMYPNRRPINEIKRTEGVRLDIVSFALDLLGKSKNLDAAIHLLLTRVGKQIGLDRVSIIEINRDYLNGHVTYQWNRNPMDFQVNELYEISREELREAATAYDAEGLCDHPVVKGFPTMESILHAAVFNHGSFEGLMSFEIHTPGHVWSEEERNVLSELVKIISSFSLRARADAASQAKTDFLSRMSHEIRTPMNAVTGMTAIAKANLGNPEKMLDCLDKIESANAYLLSLINDILDMSRIESGKMELNLSSVDMKDLIDSLDVLTRPQAETKRQQFTIENGCGAGLCVMADGLRLNQVLVNLLGNAVKFTPEHGQVKLCAQVMEDMQDEVSIRFSVEDTGIGVSEEQKGRIFNAFEQASASTSASYGGTGLGLSISSRLVQMMGGYLDVESEPENGSKFFFILSFKKSAEGENPDLSRTEEVEEDYNPHGKRILLAEDNDLNREIAFEILNMYGFEVIEAEDGRQAVEKFQESSPGSIDAILMDIRMPVMDGFEAARQIRTMGRSDSRSVTIIALTANAFDEDMKESLKHGMNGHLSKPIDVDILLKTLKQCIGTEEHRA